MKYLNKKIPMFETTEDLQVFGPQEWVYCAQHLRPHLTGWCTVYARNKVGLKVKSESEAYEKCRRLGLKLYEQ